MSTGNPLPVSVFNTLLLKLVNIVEITESAEGPLTHQARQALLQATNEFKDGMSKARELSNALPGGELLIQEQDEIIEMLERLRERKQQQLVDFSNRVFATNKIIEDAKMEIDSMASTPFAPSSS
ncbi:hypothetical protein JAAARDRAFT_197786 [Jaapia argillacea MUCL 33604]|uniref:Mediator of RNA polymerase II transcription subunit 9 n=1 Tax=Jaapia argillacea MUCL 33604 TaxID=933084 RepID=A0A067PE23_9AGAM|nr:hypothetical protein JAAARDRAFT_197786 [Jaapia argillacea MUCL 33604]